MWWSLLSAAGGLVLVVFAAEQIVKGTLGLARGLGASTFVIAVVFLGFDPENLAVGAVGSAQGTTGIATATIMGSAMVAIALALGVTALAAPVRFGQVPRRVLAVPLATVALFALLAAGGRLTRADGAVLAAGYLAAIGALTWLGRHGLDIRPAGEAAKELPGAGRLGRTRGGLLLAAGIAIIAVGGELLVTGARHLLTHFGASQTTWGMTIIALALSAEEIAREVAPALRGHPEIAIGNVVGSVCTFFGLNAGIIALIRPLPIDPPTRDFYLPVAAGTIVALCTLLAFTRRLPRWAGATLIAIYAGFLIGGFLLYGTAARS
jgi:cation:H+ antiporter